MAKKPSTVPNTTAGNGPVDPSISPAPPAPPANDAAPGKPPEIVFARNVVLPDGEAVEAEMPIKKFSTRPWCTPLWIDQALICGHLITR